MHAHLLGKLVEQLPSDLRDLMLRACSLPRLTVAIVEQLLGRRDAAVLLEALADRGLLTRFPTGEEVIYEPHGLVRAGVKSLAEKVLGVDEAKRNRVRCAELLQANELLEDAFGLWIDLGRIDMALPVLEAMSERYARQQQAQLLQRAVQRVPLDDVRQRPWIAFWAGQAMLGVDEEQARRWFDIAYAGFERHSDRPGMALSAASVLIAFNTDLDDASTVPLWLARFRASRSVLNDVVPIPWRAIVLLGVISETTLADAAASSEDDAKRAVQELNRLVNEADAWPSRDQQLEAAAVLIDHIYLLDAIDLARQVVLATEPLARDEAASPLTRGRWWLAVMRTHHIGGEHERVEFCLNQVEQLVDTAGVKKLAFEVEDYRTNNALRAHDLERAAVGVARLEQLAAGGTQMQLANVGRAAARLLLSQGKPNEARARAEAAYRAALSVGYSRRLAVVFEVEIAYAMAASGEFEEAARRTHEAALLQSGTQRELVTSFAYCFEFFASGETDRQALALALQLAARASYFRLLDHMPQLIARLCERALAHNIEVEFVRTLIARQRLLPPAGAGPAWPWRIRVWTLGGFRLEVDAAAYKPQHKAQDKPLELLKLMIAAQAENRAQPEKGWLAERLWPDADGVNARKSLDMTIARLRRLLDCDEAIIVSEGRLQLSTQQVWSDVRHLLAAIARVNSRQDDATGGKSHPSASDLDALVSGYGGEFLRGDEESPWLLGARHGLSRVFRAALLSAENGLAVDDDGRYVAALERALAAEPIAEDLARALMRAHLRRNEVAAALATYRRLRDMLSIVLNVAPSAQTEQLRQQIYRAAEVHAVANTTPTADTGVGH
jgi:DNA-binding SARP family transcriptional activator